MFEHPSTFTPCLCPRKSIQEETVKNHILVVDDDQLILYALAKVLREDGYEVVTAATATDAIEKLSYCPYDLCLLDIHLPDLNGLDLMRIIRDMCPKTKVVIMTASYLSPTELSENNRKALQGGANRFISKPFNLCDIREVMQQVLTGVENGEDGFRFTDKGIVKKSRRTPRKPYNEIVWFQMTVIEEGASMRRSLEAQAIDISDTGIGLVTGHSLKESQVISFDGKMDNRMGVVVWSKITEDGKCMAGVRFA